MKIESLISFRYARDVGPRILEKYTDYFNIPFPLPKQDMAVSLLH